MENNNVVKNLLNFLQHKYNHPELFLPNLTFGEAEKYFLYNKSFLSLEVIRSGVFSSIAASTSFSSRDFSCGFWCVCMFSTEFALKSLPLRVYLKEFTL